MRLRLSRRNFIGVLTFVVVLLGTLVQTDSFGALKMYWTDFTPGFVNGKIERSNPDGSGRQILVTGLSGPAGIAIDAEGGKMYWTDYYDYKIQRANLDGSGAENLITTGLDAPLGIALDVDAGKMYWAEFNSRKIRRANLDGSGVEDLITTGGAKKAIALDIAGSKIYWTELVSIRCANLDGSGVVNLVTTGISDPSGIALDLTAGKMYWTDAASDNAKIERANLNGSARETLVTTGLYWPRGIALDVAGGKMYWTDSNTDKIQGANLNGTAVQDLVTIGLSNPLDIVLVDIPELLLLTPNGGEELIAGTTFGITWQTTGTVENVLLEYSTNNGAAWIVIDTVTNTGSYQWTVPEENSQQCLVRISDASNSNVTDTSDDVFTIYVCAQWLVADLNGDCFVDFLDFTTFAMQWLKCGNPFNPDCLP